MGARRIVKVLLESIERRKAQRKGLFEVCMLNWEW
jgi:hypothetical protein